MTAGVFTYETWKPPAAIAHLADSCWMLAHHGETEREVVVLPDGRVDLILSCSEDGIFQIHLMGVGTRPDIAPLPARHLMFAISFRLLAVEYLFGQSIAELKDSALALPPDFWGFGKQDMADFRQFCRKAEQMIAAAPQKPMDGRKLQLFNRVYEAEGAVQIHELAKEIFWSERQINRYFNDWFGVSLKAYSNILRFRASFGHIREGKLFPEQDFADQPHFIREVKRLAGVTPRVLFRNENDRFIQFSAIGSQ